MPSMPLLKFGVDGVPFSEEERQTVCCRSAYVGVSERVLGVVWYGVEEGLGAGFWALGLEYGGRRRRRCHIWVRGRRRS